jgi:hypothetical protein
MRTWREQSERDWQLFPPCCGRGAACIHLILAPCGYRQWPNGDDLDLRVIRPIPEAFAGILNHELGGQSWQERQRERRAGEALQEQFKVLLGPHYIPPKSSDLSRPSKSGEHSHEHSHEHEHEDDSDDEVCDEPPDPEDDSDADEY